MSTPAPKLPVQPDGSPLPDVPPAGTEPAPSPEHHDELLHLTDEQVRQWSLEQKDQWWLEKVYKGDMPQLTLRSALTGMILKWATPFEDIWQAAFMAMVVAVMGFAGAMTMSAIKRDRGVRDYGTLVEGHGGVLDRIDAICFAAPVFYHISRQLLNAG